MATRPLPNPLPADLPEDWTIGQIVAPAGADAGLSEQHGYNYLMKQVNAAQRALNVVNESFDDISGKRTCRYVVGTSTAGWTQADCDYLCDGTDDQEELETAITNLLEHGGGEIVVLSGEYSLSEYIQIANLDKNITITGNPGETVLNMSDSFSIHTTGNTPFTVRIRGLTFHGGTISASGVSTLIENCVFRDCEVMAAETLPSGYLGRQQVLFTGNTVYVKSPQVLTGLLLVQLYDKGLSLIQGNSFILEDDTTLQAGAKIISISAAESSRAVFSGNFGVSPQSKGAVYSFGPNTIAQGNSFENSSVQLDDGASFVGNAVKNGKVTAWDIRDTAAPIAVLDNYVVNGSVFAIGMVQVCGNIVQAETTQPAIQATQSTNNFRVSSPSISGNYITSGSIGIHLDDNGQTQAAGADALVSGNRIWGCTTPVQIESNWSGCMITDNLFPAAQGIVNYGSDNIVRFNSDDAGGGPGGGGAAGVSSFKGRSGAVVPQSGDYTAAMVGAIPTGSVADIQVVTQAQYDALTTKDPSTLYLIKE